jgi:phenylpropionate dioxygenase-like ring-hydroxylating dioxygenase large terminal subunit
MTTQLTRPDQTADTIAAPPVEPATPYERRHNVDTSRVPFRVDDGIHVPVKRYYEPHFAELEYEKMWLHTWQWVCREEQIPDPGDYIEYTIVDKTVVVVRQPDRSIKVLNNVCPHRATQLAEPASCGTFGGNQIVCPFHGWRFNIDGSQAYIYSRKGFVPGSIDPDIIRLTEVRSAVKYGFVWINFDDDAPGMEEFLGDYDRHLEPMAMDRMRLRWWKYSVVPGNWKVALEAFLEAYHVMEAHPELAMGATGDDYDIGAIPFFHHGMGHVDSTTPFDPEDPGSYTMGRAPVLGMEQGRFFIDQNHVLFEGTDGFATARDEYIADRVRDLPDDQLLLRFFEELYKYAEEADIPLPPLDPNASTYGFVFPNLLFLGLTGNLLFYRFRPNGHDPNSAIFEALAMQIPRQCDMDDAAPEREGPLEIEEWPFVLQQDMGNIYRQQAGFRSGAITHTTMSPRYEPMIFSLHNEIDRYIATY